MAQLDPKLIHVELDLDHREQLDELKAWYGNDGRDATTTEAIRRLIGTGHGLKRLFDQRAGALDGQVGELLMQVVAALGPEFLVGTRTDMRYLPPGEAHGDGPGIAIGPHAFSLDEHGRLFAVKESGEVYRVKDGHLELSAVIAPEFIDGSLN
jgi:hypothetical protein